jgi:hypothetical protein
MNKESLVKEQKDFSAIGAEIPYELAAKMVKNHQDDHIEESYSYFIGKKIIEEILAQPGCAGIRFFDATNESGDKTLVYVGYDSNGKSILEITTVNDHGKLAVTPGMLGDKSDSTPSSNWLHF